MPKGRGLGRAGALGDWGAEKGENQLDHGVQTEEEEGSQEGMDRAEKMEWG